MPTRRLILLTALLGAGVAVWFAWPDEEAPPAVQAPAEVTALPLARPAEAASTVAQAVTLPKTDCVPAPPVNPHDRALALQRAVAQLASGSDGDAVLALLLQRPDDAAAVEPWRRQVQQAALRSQDAQALRWAASACAGAACRRALLQARVRVEPDNALHWVELIDEDPAAADEAWQGLAAAHYWREQPQAAAERVARALPPAQREALPELDWAVAPEPSPGLANACGHYGPAHPVGAACAHAATLMLEYSDSPGAWQQGADLARQMGRNDVRVPPPEPQQPPSAAGCVAKQSTR
jgi:hypothetical protein